MFDMFSAYMKEEYNKETIVTEHGFCCYFINKNNKEIFFSDLFIRPEYRNTLESKKLLSKVEQIGKDNGCEFVTGIVSIGVKSEVRVSKILKCYLSVGFVITKATNDQILIVKEIEK